MIGASCPPQSRLLSRCRVCHRSPTSRSSPPYAAGFSASGGLLTLREIEQRLGLAPRLAAQIADPREPTQVVHPTEEIVRFRMLMIAAGYEDGNDADALRHDPMFKLAMGRLPAGSPLCSQSTISRLGLSVAGSPFTPPFGFVS